MHAAFGFGAFGFGGGGFPFGGGGGGQTSFTELLSGMLDDESALSSVTELCEVLAMASEDTLGSFRVSEFVPALLRLLRMEDNNEIMGAGLLFYRCQCRVAFLTVPNACVVPHYSFGCSSLDEFG